MGRRTRKREPAYTVGTWKLRWHGKEAVAERGKGSDRERIKLGVKSPSRKVQPNLEQQAREALDIFAEARKSAETHIEAPKIGTLWTQWLSDRAADGFSNGLYNAQWVSLEPVFSHRDPLVLTLQECRDYAKDRFALGRKQWTVHNELRSIRALMKWSFENNKLPRRPKVWVPKAGENRDRVLSNEEAEALVAAALAGDPHIGLFVRIAFATAARHMAILDLIWPRVDFITNTIELDEDLPPDPMNKSWRKGRAKVPMGAHLRATLLKAREGRRCNHVVEHGGHRLVTVRSGFANAVKRAGLGWIEPHPKDPTRQVWTTDVTPHVIRHTVLTWLDKAGIPSRRRADLAGHKDVRTTDLVYTHADPELLREAVELLDERLLAKPEIVSEPEQDGSRTNSFSGDPTIIEHIEPDQNGALLSSNDKRATQKPAKDTGGKDATTP